ncbi:3-oxoacyl-[acyl-carrier-protein] synthase-3 [Bosea sp. TND4EK4]|nr:3-oxoacyl-[acyl-carrier-protein] synthase-3 [Bosea sp. TND4EK4]
MLGLAPGKALSVNGVRRRGFVADGETVSSLAAQAMEQALVTAGLSVGALDALIYASVMPEQPMPATALTVLRRLHDGSPVTTACFDINASCLGFIRALETAADGIAAGRWRHVGIAAADIASLGLDRKDLQTATLFGDGAGAAVVTAAEAHESSSLLGSRSTTFVDGYEFCQIPAGGSRFNLNRPPPAAEDRFFQMNGAALIRHTLPRFPAFLESCIEMAGGSVDVVVPHQASTPAMRLLHRLVSDRPGTTVIDILSEHGNQVSASIPTALDVGVRSGRIRRGDTILLIGTAAGVTMGAMALRY